MRYTLRNIALLPLSWMFGIVTSIRNLLFDKEVLKSTSFDFPVICIGNLAVGGTGKTPHVEFLSNVLQNSFKVAVLSRGYKRETKGFVLADNKATSRSIGDEPYQIYKKFKKIIVAVDEDRVQGIESLMKLSPNPDLIILDDAMQHRSVKPGFTILLTEHSNLYVNDSLMPVGRLREDSEGSLRADAIIVTKCPKDIKPIEMRLIEKELQPLAYQKLYFTQYKYEEIEPLFNKKIENQYTYLKLRKQKADVLLVTGIASPDKLKVHINRYTTSVKTLYFPDHHSFNKKDFELIEKEFNEINNSQKLIVVTEKDAVRIINNVQFPSKLKPYIYKAPIKVSFLKNQESSFTKKIINYVEKNSGNS